MVERMRAYRKNVLALFDSLVFKEMEVSTRCNRLSYLIIDSFSH